MDSAVGCLALFIIVGLILVIVVVGAIFGRKTKSPTVNQVVRTPTRDTTRSATPNRKQTEVQKAKWYGPGTVVNILGHEIRDGLFYLGESLPDYTGYRDDASLINPKLQVASFNTQTNYEDLGYWPEFAKLSPAARGGYLRWIVNGRSDPSADIGFVFIYFYGLERRLILDGMTGQLSEAERAAIRNEIFRLLQVYGKNNSFRRYSMNLLAAEWIIFQTGGPIPEYICVENGNLLGPFQLQLSSRVASGKPITREAAFLWLKLRPDVFFRTPARRCETEFRTLFFHLYTQKFGDGLLVKLNKKPLTIPYQAASPSLQFGIKFTSDNSPSPFDLAAPVKKLTDLAEECTTQLETYSRYLGREKSDPRSLVAISLLPDVLLIESPLAKSARELVDGVCSEGLSLFSLFDLFKKMNQKVPEQIGKKELEVVTALFDSIGFGIAPDPRYHNAKHGKDGVVAIFRGGHGIDFKPSREFVTVNTIILLGAPVANVDGNLSPSETQVLQDLVLNNRKLNQIEKESLLAVLHWCLHTPQGTAGTKQRIAALNQEDRSAIAQILISVASADGQIDPKEIRLLEKIYSSLGLESSQVVTDIHSQMAATEPVTVTQREPESAFSIPPRTDSQDQPTQFRLSKETIIRREEETRQVKQILEAIFIESDEPEFTTLTAPSPITSTTSPTEVLDGPHRSLFTKLIGQEMWERDAFDALCEAIGLMPDGAIEELNNWSFLIVNANLIEDGDPLYLDVELAKELTNGE